MRLEELLPQMATLLIVAVMGYIVGSARTFARCQFFTERLGTILATMKPFYGLPRKLSDRYR